MNKDSKSKKNRKTNKNKRRISRKGGGCGCNKGLLYGGEGEVSNPYGGNVFLPTNAFISLNPYPYNDPSAPGNITSTRLEPQPQTSFTRYGGRRNRNKNKKNKKTLKKRGGAYLNDITDFLLGPSSALSPVTSFGTTSGAVTDSNIIFANRGYVNGMPFSQPIGYKFNMYNKPMV